jgi:hypothetical protein
MTMKGPISMKGHGTKFNRKMEAAIAAILTHKNLEDAAGAAGVSVATLLRWQKLPEFQKEFRKAKRAVHAQAMARIQQATGPAVSTVLRVMSDPQTPPATRMRAGQIVIELSLKFVDQEDILARIEQLEAAADKPKK